jgi:tRNA/rRNA methyltransferase
MGRRREVHTTLHGYATEAAELPDGTRIGLVFGPEEFGLSNEELAACHFALTIPQAVDYPSLNLGQAVVCTCVELFGAIAAKKKQRQPKLAEVEEMARLYERIESALRVLGYRDVPNRNLHAAAMRTLKHVLGRAALRPGEARSLHGLFRRVEILGEKKGRKTRR